MSYGMDGWNKDAGGDLISRAAAIDIINRYNKSYMNLYEKPMPGVAPIVVDLEALPAAQPERKTGRWIDITKTGGDFIWKCSECGELNLEDTYYCPHCGAKMEVEHETD